MVVLVSSISLTGNGLPMSLIGWKKIGCYHHPGDDATPRNSIAIP